VTLGEVVLSALMAGHGQKKALADDDSKATMALTKSNFISMG
jgi:hypothetical protein